VGNPVKRPANSSLPTRFVELNQQRCENNFNFALDKKSHLSFYGVSLQTLHRMPSDQWEYRPVIPTAFFLTLSKRGLNMQAAFQSPSFFYNKVILSRAKSTQSQLIFRQNNVILNKEQLIDVPDNTFNKRQFSYKLSINIDGEYNNWKRSEL